MSYESKEELALPTFYEYCDLFENGQYSGNVDDDVDDIWLEFCRERYENHLDRLIAGEEITPPPRQQLTQNPSWQWEDDELPF